jgi:hypothetical protein
MHVIEAQVSSCGLRIQVRNEDALATDARTNAQAMPEHDFPCIEATIQMNALRFDRCRRARDA